MSAAVGKGSGDLLDAVVERLPPYDPAESEDTIDVAVVGRPNVGKSSLVNRLLGEERHVVAPEAGTTRDAIDSLLRYQGKNLNFIDTAGLRRRAKVEDDLEFYSTLRTERAIERAEVCVLVVDATLGLHNQDLRIATEAWERGCGLIVAVNKWDLVEEKDANTAQRGQEELIAKAPFLRYVPFVYVSALTGQRARKVLDLILEVAEARERRVPTAEVNRVLAALLERSAPPQKPGEEVKLLYASQIGTAPPTFAIVSNRPRRRARVLSALSGARLPRGVAVHRLAAAAQVHQPGLEAVSRRAAVWLLASYLVGAIPTSYLAGRLFRGIDLREHGSKNLGATNLYRVLGWRYAIPVGLFDIAKGAVPVLRLRAPDLAARSCSRCGCGIAAVLGHVFSVFVRFRGGKGVATAAGVMLGAARRSRSAWRRWCGSCWSALTGYVSVGSIAAAAVFPLAVLSPGAARAPRDPVARRARWRPAIIWLHRANIRRLLNGTENRFGRRAAPPARP